jgi:threonine dehydrogenase-like Zn-dependent dehydrogenase
MGLMMLELAKRVGAVSVDLVDVNPERLVVARQLGSSNAVTAADHLERPFFGWELVVDATGNEKAIQDGLGRVAPAGTFLQFGVAAYAARATIEPYKIYNQEITITGAMAVLHSFERAAELFAAGVLDPRVFITDRLPLERYAEALDTFRAGKGLKTQVLP